MLASSFDPATFSVVIAGALIAGFTTGLAGFGTALVASGLWFHVLPATMVPPLVVLTGIAGQIVGLVAIRKAFDWSRAAPYLLGGAIGVPFGVRALAVASPAFIRSSVGAFLVAYAVYQLLQRRRHKIGAWGGKKADALVGAGGGFLGGFAGLSGPLPLVWLQLRGEEPDRQRAVYQPFNLIILIFASIGMAINGQMSPDLLWIALFSLPATLAAAWIGTRVYVGVSPRTFQRMVLCILLVSGCILIGEALGA